MSSCTAHAAKWPIGITAPANAPNVLLILTDDVGFGTSSTFGGPVPTPTFSALARSGLRYNRFHTTALCSPTRAALLTGRYPHRIGMGRTTNLPSIFPGYTTVIPASAATVAQLLRAAGWSTAMFGKAHFTPEWETSSAGPFDRWPIGLGFDYFYGFLGADTSAFEPALYENTQPVPIVRTVDSDSEYHLERDLANRAIRWIERHAAIAPQKPWFIFYATGAAHAPHHAPPDWLTRFRGRFDRGWDELRLETWRAQRRLGVIPADASLAPRPPWIPRWSSLSDERRRLYARYMEAYAASLNFADEQIGRVIDAIRRTGRLHNTLIIYIQGDNGASTEGRLHGRFFEQTGINNRAEDESWIAQRIDAIGGPDSYPLLPAGWGWALNAPFPGAKREASHLGGTRNALVISWPAQIPASTLVRTQFHHVVDVMPTILAAAGVEAPPTFAGVPQLPIDGISMTYTFSDPAASERRKVQVFESFENLGYYADGWLLSSKAPAPATRGAEEWPSGTFEGRHWELYDLRHDFSQTKNLASRAADRTDAMRKQLLDLAAAQQILP
ncbi:MAG: arylsulfatase, partial [Steroidobacteraceae bacterium]|nr:arylsulfatase [Steroidobacteraceae bacterium]